MTRVQSPYVARFYSGFASSCSAFAGAAGGFGGTTAATSAAGGRDSGRSSVWPRSVDAALFSRGGGFGVADGAPAGDCAVGAAPRTGDVGAGDAGSSDFVGAGVAPCGACSIAPIAAATSRVSGRSWNALVGAGGIGLVTAG